MIKNCQVLGFRLIEAGEFELGKSLIANGFLHDSSKFNSIEWLHLTIADPEDELLNVAINEHSSRNLHHPEHWGGIKNMPQAYLAEMVCDWKARSSELGKDIREWIGTKAAKRWDFTKRDKVYRDIMKYVNLLLEQRL